MSHDLISIPNFTRDPRILDPIVLQPRKRSAAEIRSGLSFPLRVLTSPKTTLFLGATLASILNPVAAATLARSAGRFLIPKTTKGAIKAAILIPTVAGALTSKKVRGIVKSTFDPRESVRRGKRIAEIIEDPSKARDVLGIKEKQTFKEKIITGLKGAGLIGAAAAVAIGGAAALKKGSEILRTRRERKAADEFLRSRSPRSLGFTDPLPVGLGGIPVAAPQKQLTGAPGKEISKPPIQNIIQIQVQ